MQISDNTDFNQINSSLKVDKPEAVKESTLARIVSIVLHPLFMAVYGICLLFIYTDFKYIFAGQFLTFFIPVFMLSCCVPASGIYFLKRAGLIKSYELKNKSERFLPFLIVFLSYALLVHFFYRSGLYNWFLAILVAPLIMIFIAAIVSRFWKISAHMMGIGGLIGGVLSISYNVKVVNPYILFIILFILAGCLGVSRLALNRHTPAQVYVGFALGLVISYATIWVGAHLSLFI